MKTKLEKEQININKEKTQQALKELAKKVKNAQATKEEELNFLEKL